MIYPSHFNDTQKEEFRDAVSLMKKLCATSLIVHDGESFVIMELPGDPDDNAWEEFKKFNQSHSLFLEFASIQDELEGRRYYGN